MLLGDAWQIQTTRVLKSAPNIKQVSCPQTGWNQSLKQQSELCMYRVCAHHTRRDVLSNLPNCPNSETGSDFPQLVSTRPDCKSVLESCCVFQTEVYLRPEPMLPIRRIHKTPKHQRAPCSQRCFGFSFIFEFGKRLKTWMIIYLNAVRCHPLYVKISQIM